MKGVLRPAQKEKPFPIILTQPINILSPGLFTFIRNAMLLKMASIHQPCFPTLISLSSQIDINLTS